MYSVKYNARAEKKITQIIEKKPVNSLRSELDVDETHETNGCDDCENKEHEDQEKQPAKRRWTLNDRSARVL